MTLSPDAGVGRIGVVNLVRNDFVPELSMELGEPVEGGQLIINLRAEAAPAFWARWCGDALAAAAGKFATLEADAGPPGTFPPGQADADAPV